MRNKGLIDAAFLTQSNGISSSVVVEGIYVVGIMLVHTVYFWLQKGMDAKVLSDFEARMVKLGEIDSVEAFYWGKPAPTTKRPVIDDSYDYAITVVVRDVAAHDHYQEHPVHKDFVENCAKYFAKIQVYDAE